MPDSPLGSPREHPSSTACAGSPRRGAPGTYEVRPIERPDQDQRILEPQFRDDVAPHARGGRRRERMKRHAGKSSRSVRDRRYSGRKSWPHWLMQCASSIAMKRTSHCCSSGGTHGRRPRPGARATRRAGGSDPRGGSRSRRRARRMSACCSGTPRPRRPRAGRRPDPSSAR